MSKLINNENAVYYVHIGIWLLSRWIFKKKRSSNERNSKHPVQDEINKNAKNFCGISWRDTDGHF